VTHSRTFQGPRLFSGSGFARGTSRTCAAKSVRLSPTRPQITRQKLLSKGVSVAHDGHTLLAHWHHPATEGVQCSPPRLCRIKRYQPGEPTK
jgi:hypothetical protein